MPFLKLDMVKAYLLDWILCVVFLVAFYGLDKVEPYHRLFSLEDKTIQFPFTVKERVPMWLCVIISVVVPYVVMTFTALVIKKRNMHDWHHSSLGLLMGLTLALMITALFKNTVGRPRPDFIDRCQPAPGSVDSPNFGLSNSTICTRHDLLTDGFKSFLSGHSSTSFAGLGFLSFYLAGKLHVFDRKGYAYKGFIVAAPLMAAILIAVSRTQDYRHHWQDVLAGSLVGIGISYFSYRQYYPGLHSPLSDKPFSVRLKKHKPEYKANFTFMDGSKFAITVVKKDEERDEVLLNVNDSSILNVPPIDSSILVPPIDPSPSSTIRSENPLIV